MELSQAAGWNQTKDDWEMMLRLEPQGCFAIKADNRVAATTTLLCYGRRLAWIGMVLTRPEYRRMGFAQRLMEHTLKRASELKIESVMLDATPLGQPLYEKLGFRTEQIVERWFREGQTSPTLDQGQRPLIPYSKDMDVQAFGADRSLVLRELSSRNLPNTANTAYCFSRSGFRARYLGPCIAADMKTARAVIEQTLQQRSESGWFWDVLVRNENAARLAGDLGFKSQRRLERMVLGKSLPANEALVFAIAGFELG